MKYKALMLDVDGTTIPNKNEGMPSERVTNAINKASQLLHVGLVTGRPFCNAHHLMKHLDLKGPSIVSGGAQVVDSHTGKILWEKTITRDTISNMQKLAPDYELYITDGIVETSFKQTPELNKILASGILGIYDKEAEMLMSQFSHFSDVVFHIVPSWQKGKVDFLINHVSATKLHGIVEVARILTITTKEIIGVGDGGNDMPLLMSCGLKVAMGNANENLKVIADYVAPTVDEDGVAHVIERFLLNS